MPICYTSITLLLPLLSFSTESIFIKIPHQYRIKYFSIMVSKKKEIVRDLLRNNDVVKLYCNHFIPFYDYVMLILC